MIADQRAPVWMGLSLKHIALFLLTFQNSALILIMHYSRIMPPVEGQRYLPSTAVFATEIIKLSISLTMALYEIYNSQPNLPATSLFATLAGAIIGGDSWKMAIPAMLYTLQNTLQYIAISNLDASTFQITYQLKILTTALFSVLLLNRKLSGRKWASLLFLTLGVVVVQMSIAGTTFDWQSLKTDIQSNLWLRRSADQYWSTSTKIEHKYSKRSATYQGIEEDVMLQYPILNGSVGLVAVLIACISSGFSGVYFEKLLKSHSAGQGLFSGRANAPTLWIRNTQLSLYSVFPALFIGVLFKDGEYIARHGFFTGYNWIVWTTIIVQALGGVVVALVINYANNIAKNFATSISVVISVIGSVQFFNLSITTPYLVGTTIVIAATWLYNTERSTIPASPTVIVGDYEKTEHAQHQGYPDAPDTARRSRSENPVEFGLSTSRPGTPVGHDRHHFRTASARRQFDKRGE